MYSYRDRVDNLIRGFEFHECATVTKSSSHGLCSICAHKRAPTERQLELMRKTKDRERKIRASAKIFSLESIYHCEFQLQMCTNASVKKFMKSRSELFCAKETFAGGEELIEYILNGKMQCLIRLTAVIPNEHREFFEAFPPLFRRVSKKC